MVSREINAASRYLGHLRSLHVDGRLVLILLIHFQFFFASNTVWENHLFSFRYGFELYLLLSLSMACTFPFWSRAAASEKVMLLGLAALALLFMTSSAIFANLKFGQPVSYGMIETRRTLTFLNLFVVSYYVQRAAPSVWTVYVALCVCVAVQIVLSIINQLAFPHVLLARDVPALDMRKLRITNGSHAYVALIFFSFCLLLQARKAVLLMPMFLCSFAILYISQSRTLFGLVGLVILVRLLLESPFVTLATTAFASLLVWGAVLFDASITGSLGGVLDQLAPGMNFSEIVSSGDSIRSATLTVIFEQLAKNCYFGLGALSLQWNDGFSALFGKHFFLADVGMFGEIFQVGMLYPVFCSGLAVFMLYMRHTALSQVGKEFVFCMVLFLAFGAPLGGFFYQFGFLVSFAYLVVRSTERVGFDERRE